LVHFLLLGALIFVAYGWLNRYQQQSDEIVVTRGQQEHLANIFARTWQRPPTAEEFKALVDDFVRQEVAYREGSAMGLVEGDTVIRRRVRQKLELLADEMVSMSEPSDEEMVEYLEENEDQFMLEPRLDLRQVYVSRDRRGSAAQADALEKLEILRHNADVDWTAIGDPLPIPAEFDDIDLSQLERQFGSRFAQQLARVERGAWTGPVESGFGLHLVFVDDFVPARTPGLDEVRQRVRTEWFAERRQAATDQLYERLAEKYSIEVEPLMEGESP